MRSYEISSSLSDICKVFSKKKWMIYPELEILKIAFIVNYIEHLTENKVNFGFQGVFMPVATTLATTFPKVFLYIKKFRHLSIINIITACHYVDAYSFQMPLKLTHLRLVSILLDPPLSH